MDWTVNESWLDCQQAPDIIPSS